MPLANIDRWGTELMTSLAKVTYGGLQDLTVILLTKNRPALAIAAVQQWAGLARKVVVADGSDDPSTELEQFSDVLYFWSKERVERRLQHAAALVETDFAMLQSDDDIFVPGVVNECIAELQTLSDYVAVTPTSIKAHHSRFRLTYPKAVTWDNAGNSCNDRMQHLAAHYIPSCIYGICRAEELKRSFVSMGKNPLPVYAFGELHHEFVMNALGKVRIHPVVGWIRRDVSKSVETREDFNNQLWFARRDGELRAQFVEGVARSVAPELGEPLDRVRKSVDDALETYALSASERSSGMWTRTLRLRIKGAYKRLVPKRARTVLKPTIGKVLSATPKYKTWEDLRDDLERQGIRLPPEAAVALEEREQLEARTVLGER